MALNTHIDGTIALVLAKLETTYGTDPTLATGADEIYCQAVSLTPQWTEVGKTRVRNTFPQPGVAIADASYAVQLVVPGYGPPDPGGAALGEPPWSALAQACRLGLASTGGPPVDTHTYAPDSTSGASVAIEIYWSENDGSNWYLTQILGARGTWSYSGAAGAEGLWTFDLQGLYSPPTDAAAPTGVDFGDAVNDSIVPRGNSLTVDGRTDEISSLTINGNNEVSLIKTQDATYGVGCVRTAIGQATIEHDAALVLEGTYARHANVLAETGGAATLILDSVEGARTTVSVTDLQPGSFSYDAGSGIRRVSQTLYPRDTSGDDAYSIAITRAP